MGLMRSYLDASNLDTKRGIHHTWTFWQPTHQSFPMRSTMVADRWLRTTESKFGLLHYTEYQKIVYAAQQFQGSAGAWWATYTVTLPADHHIPWGEFHTTLCAHHLSAGLLCSKMKEFLDLEQGNHSMFDYTRQFDTLAHIMIRMRRKPTSVVKGLPSTWKSACVFPPTCPIMNWRVPPLIKRG
jgi:hypothetical protein